MFTITIDNGKQINKYKSKGDNARISKNDITILLILRMNFLRMQINNVNKYYYYLIIFLMMLFFSIYNQTIFFILEIIMIINILFWVITFVWFIYLTPITYT